MITNNEALEDVLDDTKHQNKDEKIHPWRICPIGKHFVKKHIVSESSFHPETDIPSGQGDGRARGLMQITDATMHILGDHHGELSNHLICFDHSKLLDPSANICAGVRWLFRTMIIAKSRQ